MKDMSQKYRISKLFNFLGFGKVQILVFISAFLILGNTLAETMGISFVIPAAVCDLNLSETDKGLLSGMTFLGKLFQENLNTKL